MTITDSPDPIRTLAHETASGIVPFVDTFGAFCAATDTIAAWIESDIRAEVDG